EAVQRLDLALLINTKHHGAFGRVVVQPDDVDDLLHEKGSVDSLKDSCRCGLRPNFFQIRPMVDFDSPVRAAIEARDQWVSLPGTDSNVATTTSSTWSSR